MRAEDGRDPPAWAQALLREARVARLGLRDDAGHPRVLPVTFAAVGHTLWTAVDHKLKRDPSREPARVRYLRQSPEAALTVDHYDDDWSPLAGVQVLGRVEVGDVADHRQALAALRAKYAPYRGHAPRGRCCCCIPARAFVARPCVASLLGTKICALRSPR